MINSCWSWEWSYKWDFQWATHACRYRQYSSNWVIIAHISLGCLTVLRKTVLSGRLTVFVATVETTVSLGILTTFWATVIKETQYFYMCITFFYLLSLILLKQSMLKSLKQKNKIIRAKIICRNQQIEIVW